ncbi:MAG: SNF2 family helicase, partial [Kiritimatiellaeota bacterium]|nr:SNF2 family helicase [Kiritimatiellota bacterium]
DRSVERAAETERARVVQQAEAEGLYPLRIATGMPFKLRFRVGANWEREYDDDKIKIDCNVMADGEAKPMPIQSAVRQRLPLLWRNPSQAGFDDFALGLLEELCPNLTGDIFMKRYDFIALLKLLSIHGRPLYAEGTQPLTVRKEPVESKISVDLDRESGEILVMLHTAIPGMPEGGKPHYLVFGLENPVGFAYWRGEFHPLAKVLPGPMQQVYRETIVIPRAGILRFLRLELNNLTRNFPGTESLFDFKTLEFKPVAPKFSLKVKGSLASVALTFFAVYEDRRARISYNVPVGETGPDPNFCIPDPDDIMSAYVRDNALEKKALETLRELGIAADSGTRIAPINEERHVLNFLGATIPRLGRLGFMVEIENGSPIGEAYNTLPKVVAQVKICKSPDSGYFEIGYSFEEIEDVRRKRIEIDRDEIVRSIALRDSFVKKNGETYLFDAAAFMSLADSVRDCDSEPASRVGFTRLRNFHAPYVKSSVDSIIDSGSAYYAKTDAIADWSKSADRQNHIEKVEPVRIEGHLETILRPYQRDGVAWLRFMEGNGLGGILADEMGLGKTVQTLAWLRLKRHNPADEGKPALVVCPTSLLDNWAKEVEMFTPELSVLVMRGAERRDMFDMIPNHNLVVTSYALLRRDIGEYTQHRFSAVILDEAQNIKNRATMNAKSVKALRSDGSRFVLTGTPMENTVADLWSIMDFLMPGYLGDYQEFRMKYELPLSLPVADPNSEIRVTNADRQKYEEAKSKLRQKLRPFLLRRKKSEVAKDLPPKITSLSWCHLSREQQAVYDKILETTRIEIQGMVRRQGFDKSRMAILTALLRLRQVCCHLTLLGDLNPLPDAKDPSSKLDQFFEIFEESVSDGHRILVFSQFVKMLHVLRAEFDARGIKYCYLDGSSDDRAESVERFNTDASIPVFLISLKAGGTGLNLAGADTVIHLDPWWNPAVEDQATDRAHRIGQKKTVYCIKLITAATVEEKVLLMQQRKRAIIGATVESDEQTVSKLTWDDIKELLSL